MTLPHYVYVFVPLTFATPDEATVLSTDLAEQGVSSAFTLRARRRRGVWGTTLPLGVFENVFNDASYTRERHLEQCAQLVAKGAEADAYGCRPYPLAYEAIEADGELYYHPEAIYALSKFVERPAFLRALYRFLEAANRNRALIVPPQPRRKFVPLDKRVEVFGHAARGPSWTPDEDAVVRRWFGQRTVGPSAGKHVALTEDEWKIVLSQLPRRTKSSVRQRIVALNEPLQREYLRHGFVSQALVREYMSKVLGERPRCPLRPRRVRKPKDPFAHL